MQPFFQYKDASTPEKNFERFLDSNDHVDWWFKNRENDPKYFAIGYADENGYNSAFYVDFIVMFKDGSIGFYDTKQGITASAESTKNKAEALYRFIQRENQSGKKVKYDIVISVNKLSGTTWKINCNETYTDDFDNAER